MALSVTAATSAPALVASKRTLVVRTPMWPLRDVALPLLATRLALTLVGLVASSGNFMATWADWDAGWYLSIALHGYGLDGQNDLNQANSAFAPALPLLMHVASFLVAPWASPEAAALVGGVLIANVALFVALAYLLALVRQDFDAPTASRAVLYALVFPSSLFLSAVYPHALFLAGAIGAVYHARRGQWWLAGGLAAFAALAGVHGCVIVIPLAFEYLAAPGFGLNPVRIDRASLRRHVRIDRANVRRLVHSDALALLLPLASAGAFAIVLWLQAGDPLAMLGAGSQWQRHFGAPWAPFLTYLRDGLGAHGSNTSPLDLAFTLLLIALVALSWVRVRRSLALFATLLLLISLSSGLLVSSMRYGLELFPIFIVLAVSGRNRLCHFAYLGSSAYLALRFMSEFAQSIWVA